MLSYSFFVILIAINFFVFNVFIKIAKKIGITDNSKKFGNPITITSAGIIFYLNLIFLLTIQIFFEENFIKTLPNNFFYTLLALTIIVIMSAVDDIKPIDPKIRLICQLICIYFSTSSIPIYEINLPIKISIFICLSLWVYIINITNFTDGSDGFLATNTIFVLINVIFINNYFDLELFSSKISIFMLPTLTTFIYFNRPNAKFYMGDSGSILIGFINGFIFLELFTGGYLFLGISLLIYPLMDCSIALTRKTLRGKLPWVDISNYSFLQPNIKKIQNKFFVFHSNIVFNILNTVLIIAQIFVGWYLIILNIILTLIFINIYENKN